MNNLNNIKLNVARTQAAIVVDGMKDLLRKNGIAFRFETGELKNGFHRGVMSFKLTHQGSIDFNFLPLNVRQNIKAEMLKIANENGCCFASDLSNPLPRLCGSVWGELVHVEEKQRDNVRQDKWRMEQAARRMAAC